MKVLWQYVRLEGKLCFLKLGVLLLIGTGGALLFGLVFYGLSCLFQGRMTLPKAVVGLVDEGDKGELKTLQTIASSMDSVKEFLSLQLMGREEAMEALETGKLQALILFPKDFYRDVMTGINTPARILIPENSPFQTGVFKELLVDGASLIGVAEAGIYAAEDIHARHGGVLTRRELELELTRRFTLDALNRRAVFTDQELFPLEGADIPTWYLSSFLTLLFLLLSAFPRFFYSKEELALEKRLTLYGVPRICSRAAKLFWLVLMNSLILWGLDRTLCFLPGLQKAGPLFSLNGILPILGCALFSDVCYRLFGTEAGVLAILLLGGSMILTGGLALPGVFLPKEIALIGSMLPAAIWHRSFLYAASPALLGVPEPTLSLFWIAVFILAVPLIRRLKGEEHE